MYKIRSTDGKYTFTSTDSDVEKEVEFTSFQNAKAFLFSTLRASLPDSIEFAIYDPNDEVIYIDTPTVKQQEIWFSDEQHRSNFETLMQIYSHRGSDVQYKAHNYIAAYPALFDCFDTETLNNSYGGIYSIMQCNGMKRKRSSMSLHLRH